MRKRFFEEWIPATNAAHFVGLPGRQHLAYYLKGFSVRTTKNPFAPHFRLYNVADLQKLKKHLDQKRGIDTAKKA